MDLLLPTFSSPSLIFIRRICIYYIDVVTGWSLCLCRLCVTMLLVKHWSKIYLQLCRPSFFSPNLPTSLVRTHIRIDTHSDDLPPSMFWFPTVFFKCFFLLFFCFSVKAGESEKVGGVTRSRRAARVICHPFFLFYLSPFFSLHSFEELLNEFGHPFAEHTHRWTRKEKTRFFLFFTPTFVQVFGRLILV